MMLREIAHVRTGDKGDISNIAVIAYRPSNWPRLEKHLTTERVACHFGAVRPADVSRYLLPQLCAMNFVIRGVLAGGVTRSLALDAHGKCLGATLLSLPFPDDD